MRIPLALALTAALTFPAHAANHCETREHFLQHLGFKYHERPVGFGISGGGALVEILSSPDGKTWTIIATLPDGCSRMVVTGKDWFVLESEKGDPI